MKEYIEQEEIPNAAVVGGMVIYGIKIFNCARVAWFKKIESTSTLIMMHKICRSNGDATII